MAAAAVEEPPTFGKEVCDEVRNNFQPLAAQNESLYHPDDLVRIKIDDVYVSRFLTHQKEDKMEAAKMIDSVLIWRQQNGIRDLDFSDVKNKKSPLNSMFYRSKDKEGSDILWVQPKFFDHTQRREFEQYLLWLIETRPGAAECSQITIALALDGVGLSQVDVEFNKFFINYFMYHTPDTMKRMIVHNMHWLLNGVWKLLSVLLSEGARKRVIFLKNKDIHQYIAEELVLSCCGGPDPHCYKA